MGKTEKRSKSYFGLVFRHSPQSTDDISHKTDSMLPLLYDRLYILHRLLSQPQNIVGHRPVPSYTVGDRGMQV